MKTYDRQAAYQAVMERIRTSGKMESSRAPAPWLSEQLKVPRQLVYVWAERGIPEEHAEAIAAMLGMDTQEVCPHMPMYLPEDVFQAIVQSKKKKSFRARLVKLIRRGLKIEDLEEVEQIPRPSPVPRAKEQPMKAVGGFIPISAEELETQREEAIKAGADLSVRGRSK